MYTNFSTRAVSRIIGTKGSSTQTPAHQPLSFSHQSTTLPINQGVEPLGGVFSEGTPDSAGRHAGHIREFEEQTAEQLEKSIKSFDKNIQKHSEWIKDPKLKYGDRWNEMSKQHQENAIHHWGKDIERAEEFKKLAEEILKKK